MIDALSQYDRLVSDNDDNIEAIAVNRYFNAAVALMDDEIRERLHDIGFPGVDDEHRAFLAAYCAAHEAQYGEAFAVN